MTARLPMQCRAISCLRNETERRVAVGCSAWLDPWRMFILGFIWWNPDLLQGLQVELFLLGLAILVPLCLNFFFIMSRLRCKEVSEHHVQIADLCAES